MLQHNLLQTVAVADVSFLTFGTLNTTLSLIGYEGIAVAEISRFCELKATLAIHPTPL
jgi:hypothetical protein